MPTDRRLTGKQYACCTFGLIAAFLLGNLVFKIPQVKSLLAHSPVNPVPVFWCAVLLAILFLIPRMHTPGLLRYQNQVLGMAFSCAMVILTLRFAAGFFMQSIAASPYDRSPVGILQNLILFFPAMIAREMIRAYALGTASRDTVHFRIWVPLLTLVLCASEINFTKILALTSVESWFIYIAKDILPLLTQGCLLTALVLYGGAGAGILYGGSVGAFAYVFPFLPSLPWIADSVLGITFPAMTALFVLRRYRALIGKKDTLHQDRIVPYVAALALTVAFSWFVVGVFPVYPSVILTGSMEPELFPGDVILIHKFASAQEIYNLAEDDIINFRQEDITITHRIVAVVYDAAGNVSFQTKGDNNKVEDEREVLPADLNGIVKKVIPKVGTPILWLHKSDPIPEGAVHE